MEKRTVYITGLYKWLAEKGLGDKTKGKYLVKTIKEQELMESYDRSQDVVQRQTEEDNMKKWTSMDRL